MKPGVNPLFLILILVITFWQQGHSQGYADEKKISLEYGLGIGAMNCITDLGGPRGKGGLYFNDVNWKNTELNVNAYISAFYKKLIGVRVEVTSGSVSAYDSILAGTNKPSQLGRYTRNLSFRSSIKEVTLLTEFHPLLVLEKFSDFRVSPYVLAGVGYFSFNPQAKLNNRWVDLEPLHTEGQGFAEYPDRKPYDLSQFHAAFGGGISVRVSDYFYIKLEVVHRKLYTDYLDDVSTDYIDPALFSKYLSPEKAADATALYARSLNPVSVGGIRGNTNQNDVFMSFNLKVKILFPERSGFKTSGLKCWSPK